MALPSPTGAARPRAELFLDYLTYFRERVVEKVSQLSDGDLDASILPSQWTPLGLVKHVTYVEMRWLEWGFEGRMVADPWGDRVGDRFATSADDTRSTLLEGLRQRGEVTNEIVRRHDLDEVGQPGERWDGDEPATLERVLFHLVQEYARHVGHLDIYVELVTRDVGE
jgi:uncharacterized damage-inducible protein DinB